MSRFVFTGTWRRMCHNIESRKWSPNHQERSNGGIKWTAEGTVKHEWTIDPWTNLLHVPNFHEVKFTACNFFALKHWWGCPLLPSVPIYCICCIDGESAESDPCAHNTSGHSSRQIYIDVHNVLRTQSIRQKVRHHWQNDKLRRWRRRCI